MHTSLLPLVGTRFQVLFHSPPGVLFTFPSRYWCTIGHGLVFSLGGWSPQLPTGFLVPRRTQDPKPPAQAMFRLRDSHPLWWSVPARFGYMLGTGGTRPALVLQPQRSLLPWFGLFPVRSPLLGKSHVDFSSSGYLDVSVLPVGFASSMDSKRDDGCLHPPGFPIRTSSDHRMRAPPRGFSQLTTSFVADPCLGIHRAPFVTLDRIVSAAEPPPALLLPTGGFCRCAQEHRRGALRSLRSGPPQTPALRSNRSLACTPWLRKKKLLLSCQSTQGPANTPLPRRAHTLVALFLLFPP